MPRARRCPLCWVVGCAGACKDLLRAPLRVKLYKKGEAPAGRAALEALRDVWRVEMQVRA
jgi:hypothetical protein